MTAPNLVKRYFVLGNPIAHSRSPAIHAAFAAQSGLAVDYQRLEIPLGEFAARLQILRADGVAGVNVTVPFKLDAFACATSVSPRARLAQAANTLKFEGAEIYADNTDGAGLVADITQNLGCPLACKNVLLLGAGGAALGVAGVLLEGQLAGLYVLNRSVEKAVTLARQFKHLGHIEATGIGDLPGIKFDVIINATSASLTPSAPSANVEPPIWARIKNASKGGLAYDMMYGAAPSAFMLDMAKLGMNSADGLGMLVEQAAEAFYLWHGVRPETKSVITQIRAQLCQQ